MHRNAIVFDFRRVFVRVVVQTMDLHCGALVLGIHIDEVASRVRDVGALEELEGLSAIDVNYRDVFHVLEHEKPAFNLTEAHIIRVP